MPGFWQRWTNAPSPEEDEAEAQRQLFEHELLDRPLSLASKRPGAAVTVRDKPAATFMPQESPRIANDSTGGASEYQMPSQRVYVAERVQPFLPTGTVIRQVFGVQRSVPIPIAVINVILTPLRGWRVVAVTDEAIYVLAASYWLTWRPKRLLRTLPRTTYFGLMDGPYTKIQLGPESAWVFWRFYKDVEAANAQTLRGPFD
jgi:hypothetical protein